MLKDADAGRFDIVVAVDIDRLLRSTKDLNAAGFIRYNATGELFPVAAAVQTMLASREITDMLEPEGGSEQMDCQAMLSRRGEQGGMVEGLDCAHGEGLASGVALVAVPMTQHRSSVGRISLLSWRPGSSSCLSAEVLQCWCSAAYRLRRPG